jgi:hypothetical protein
VLYAPDYWIPCRDHDRLNPPFRVHFRLPGDARNARIYFAAPARVFAPGRTPYPDGKPRQGWLDLPAGRGGLWSFEPAECGVVRLVNAPPFFSFHDPGIHFVPDVVRWPAAQAETPPPAGEEFVAGVSGAPDDRAVNLVGGKYLKVDAPAGREEDFFPLREGTIEFHLKPAWNSFGPAPVERRGLIAVPEAGFFIDLVPSGGINAAMDTEADGEEVRVGWQRKDAFFARGRWTHVAVVWGDDGLPTSSWHGPMRGRMCSKYRVWVFIDGKRGNRYQRLTHEVPAEGRRCSPMRYVGVGGMGKNNRVEGAIDNLRISGIQRYRGDFTPPARATRFLPDEHTRALFLFDGDIEGYGDGLDEPLRAELK